MNLLRHTAIFSAPVRRVSATAALLVLTATAAIAHPQSSGAINEQDDWKVAVYPVFAWLPMGIDIDVEVPPGEGGGSGGAGAIVDGRFDGAYRRVLRRERSFQVDADGLWAAVGGDRPDLPFLKVDVDAVYFHLTGGVKVVKDLYVTGGVRRLSLRSTSHWVICRSSNESWASGIRW